MNYNPSVNPKLAKRVWAAVKDLGYVPNTQARALVSGRSGLLGLVISDITNPLFPELVQAFENIAIANGYQVLISSTNYDAARTELCATGLIQSKVEGVAILTSGFQPSAVAKLAARHIPLVFLDEGIEGPGIRILKIDYRSGIQQGVQHLAVLGHRKIGFIAGPAVIHSAREQLEAFREALRYCGIVPVPDWLLLGDHTLEGGMRCASEIFSLSDQPTAIMCSNDLTAIGVMHEANRAGVQIPESLSIIGFDDIEIARIIIPPLTTIQVPRVALANAAMRALKVEISEEGQLIPTQIETRLVVRSSTNYPAGTLQSLKG